ncbi:hypothetical protein [Planobispora rosea]|uniref:hypothetical protein n=1 Tax=Planobispora rosea TaxID=35762 RepID=UPI00083B4029|nr:hypothetical protein [Planobispora rosea]
MAVRVILNRSGVREMLRSEGVQDELMRRARRVASAAEAIGVPPHEGDVDYYAEASMGRSRARALVIADHPGALGQEEKYRTLGTAIDAAGG